MSLHWNQLFLITTAKGTPLCVVVQTEQAGCATTTMEEQTLKEIETEEAPPSVNCLPLAQHQTDETPLGWETGSSAHFFRYSQEPPCYIKGEKFDVEGLGVCESVHQCSGGRCTDHTGEA